MQESERTPARYFAVLLLLISFGAQRAFSTQPGGASKTISGIVVTGKDEAVRGVTVTARFSSGEATTVTDDDGQFRLDAPTGPVTLRIEGKNIASQERVMSSDDATRNLRFVIEFVIPPVHQSVVIMASTLEPAIERRNGEAYKQTLFSRDDQLLETLNAGINAGQHEGGGKSLEIRRFGFNLDHGGVNGGLKMLVNDIPQNQATQGHGQGYLGQLKSLTPELVEEVNILNGPFSAEYGDFSGLGVVHIRLRESLPDQATLRLEGGSFDSCRTFLAYSPPLQKADSFLAYEGSRTDGPFLNPQRYERDNVTSNYTRHLRQDEALGFKMNFGRNDFFSSGQIPLDEVAAGHLDRFGFVDPSDGGRVRSGTFGVYYRRGFSSGDILKLDGFLARSLFDLYSNFTFFRDDPVQGDAFQQHDSRYQEGFNSQYLHVWDVFGHRTLLTLGNNFHDNQINVGLYPREGRNPVGITTRGLAHVTNTAGYAQQAADLLRGRLHLEGGIRWDYFRFHVGDQIRPDLSGTERASQLQPKAGVAYTLSAHVPLTVYFNYGRGITSQDARGVVQKPASPRISTTDFYQVGTSHRWRRVSWSTDLFLIDRSSEQVYIPDDGSLEFKGLSRAYGFEGKTSVQLTRRLAFDGGLTQVTNAYYRATFPRVYVDSAPHTVANAGLTLAGWRGVFGSLRGRHIGNYRLDGADAAIRASGLDVLDLSISKRLRRWVDANLAIDNLADKIYYETQTFFQSRVRPSDPVIARIHGTPGYPFGVTLGVTFHLFNK